MKNYNSPNIYIVAGEPSGDILGDQLIKLTGFVNCIESFTQQPLVINGCSNMMKDIFGETGVHARAAVGVNSLPLGFTVEIEAMFKIKS